MLADPKEATFQLTKESDGEYMKRRESGSEMPKLVCSFYSFVGRLHGKTFMETGKWKTCGYLCCKELNALNG